LERVKLFISYRSLDSDKVDAIVSKLRNIPDDDNSIKFELWQDKYGIPDGHDWWESILNAIEDCKVFVFMLSKESAKNVNCRAELKYARELNRPILPIVLDEEFYYNPAKGKHDIRYWDDLPSQLKDSRFQLLFYDGAGFVGRMTRAIQIYLDEPEKWRPLKARRPSHPDPQDATTVENRYSQACDFAWREEYREADKWFQNLINLGNHGFYQESVEWIEILRIYQDVVLYANDDNLRYRLEELWEEYTALFPKRFLNADIFDPEGIADLIADGADEYIDAESDDIMYGIDLDDYDDDEADEDDPFGGTGDFTSLDDDDNVNPTGGGFSFGQSYTSSGDTAQDDDTSDSDDPLASLRERFGGIRTTDKPDKKDDKKSNNDAPSPLSGAIGGLRNRFGDTSTKDKKDDKKSTGDTSSSVGGALGGLRSRFGDTSTSDKKDDKKSNNDTPSSLGTLGGLRSRLGDASATDKKSPSSSRSSGTNTSPFGRRKTDTKKDDKKSTGDTSSSLGGLGGFRSRLGDASATDKKSPSSSRFGGRSATDKKPSSTSRLAGRSTSPFGRRSDDKKSASRLDKKQSSDTDNTLQNIVGIILSVAVLAFIIFSVLSPDAEANNHRSQISDQLTALDNQVSSLTIYWTDIEETGDSPGCDLSFDMSTYDIPQDELETLENDIQTAVSRYNFTIGLMNDAWTNLQSACGVASANDAISHINIGKSQTVLAQTTVDEIRALLES